MKKLLFVLPVVLLITLPSVVFARENEPKRHGVGEAEIHRSNDDHDNGKKLGTLSSSKDDEDENEVEIEEENEKHKSDHSDNSNGGVRAKIKIEDNSNEDGVKLSIKIHKPNGSTVSATHSATPSASIKISGPIDQVIEMLSKVLDFLKSLI